MLKSVKAGKTLNLDDMPPPVMIKETISTAKDVTPTTDKPHPSPCKPDPKPPPSNLVDLDAPEFDEFNLTEEDLASMASAFVDDRKQSQSSTNTSVSQSSSKTGPPQPKPRSQAKTSSSPVSLEKPRPQPSPKPPPTRPDGLIDLDDPAFDEFTLTDEDMEAMAQLMVDDRATKKQKMVDQSSKSNPQAGSLTPSKPPPQAPVQTQASRPQPVTQSLPSTLSKPISGDSAKDILQSFLEERMEQYKSAAKAQKDPTKNKEYRVIAAKFSRVIKAVSSGQDIDLTQMPGPPPGYKSSFVMDLSKFSAQSSAPKPETPPTQQSQSSSTQSEEPDVGPNSDIPVPKTALEALEQRLSKYKEGLRTAQEKGESSRVRRMGRIIKQYESAIKDTKSGKPCDYNDLPTPPGYPPIPASTKPIRQVKPAMAVPLPTQSLPVQTSGAGMQQNITPSISQKQIAFVEHRMAELKTAAKQEQVKKNREGALHYMKMVKGLETMLQAARNGLPVNLEQVPPSPFADISKTKPSAGTLSHLRPAEEKDAATFELIIKQLEKQIEICDRNAETYKKMGSNASAIEYTNMSQNCQRELLAIKGIQTGGYGPPIFSLETRKITLIHSNTHLSGSVCEVEIVCGVDLQRPPKYEEKDMHVYVEVEFPYPSESPPKMSTDAVQKTCSPEFNKSFLFDIDRKHHRSMLRAFKRTPLKCTVWQQRSLRKDIFIGMM